MKAKIIRTFQLSPEIICPQIDQQVLKKAKEYIVGTCCEVDGYITDIEDVEILEADISNSTGLLDIKVACNVQCMKPKKDDKYSGRICLIFDMGLLIDVAGVLKILVPINNDHIRVDGVNQKATFDSRFNSVAVENRIFEKGMISKVNITGVQYNPTSKAYNCFGELCFSTKKK